MISLCITGHSAAAIAAAQAALTAAGMTPARGLERDSHITFSTWHERVYQALEQSQAEPGEDEDDSTQGVAPATISRLWEQLANDLFLANMDAKVWGWADAKSMGLLDFWLELDASTHFVLLATPPEQFLAEHLAQLAQEPDRSLKDLPVDSLMDQWQQAHQTMLRFALHHPKRCVLLLAELPLPADALVHAVKGAWARKLKALRAEHADAIALEPSSGADSETAVLRHFAAELCQAYPQAQSLQHEIESVALALHAPVIGVQQALLDSVLSTVSLASQVPALKLKATELAAEFEAQKQLAVQIQVQVRAEFQDLLNDEKKAKNQVLAEAERQQLRLKSAEQEGGLLLSQLHQSQEELERYFQCNAELEAQVQTLSATRDSETKAKIEALKQRDALAQEKATLATALETAVKAKDEALKHRDTLAQENISLSTARDADAAAKSEAIKQFEAEAKAKTEALKERNALAQEKAALMTARDAETKAKVVASENARAAGQENDLLLAQLHQVQEELERYVLRNKDLEAKAAQAGQRLMRMVGRQTNGIAWESVQTEIEPGSGGAQLRCRATQVVVSAKEWDSVEFTAHIHGGALAFGFTRGPDQPKVLTRWPHSAAAADCITATVYPDAEDQDGNSLLKEISTSDWDLLCGLPKLVAQGLQQIRGPLHEGSPSLQAWQDATRATLPALQRQPLAVRVDTLRLLGNFVQAGREYLVLRAEQLSLANKRFTAIDFRLGCNLGPKGEFGQSARLEFFKGSTPATFDNWAPNVRDPAGDRLDLVFVFPTSMNLKDWAALSVNDRGMVLLLADQLPALLADMQPEDVRLSRSLDAWLELANKVRSFVRQRLDVTGVQQAMPEAVPNELPLPPSAAPRRARAPKLSARPAPKRAVSASIPANATEARGRKK